MKYGIYLLPVALVFAINIAVAETVPQQKAKEVGVKKCLENVTKFSDFYIKNAEHSADAAWNKKSPDDRLISFFVSRGYSDGDSQINMQFAPNSSGSCDVVFTETYVIESQCSIVREDNFKTWKYRASMNNKTLVLANDNGAVDVYLTPAGKKGDMCLVTIREVGF